MLWPCLSLVLRYVLVSFFGMGTPFFDCLCWFVVLVCGVIVGSVLVLCVYVFCTWVYLVVFQSCVVELICLVVFSNVLLGFDIFQFRDLCSFNKVPILDVATSCRQNGHC